MPPLALFAALIVATPANAASCTAIQLATGTCTIDASVNGGQVVLDGSETRPGQPGGRSDRPATPARGGGSRGSDSPRGSADTGRSGGSGAQAPSRDGYTVTYPGQPDPIVPPVTLRDLLGFAPAPGTDHMEPNVVGLDTNFYAQVGVQVQNGQLLGRAASVRFTPVRYHWSYGDGTSAVRTVKGATWAAQGIPEFDPTATSHVYRAKGTYLIDLTIDFRAEYRYAGFAWTSIAGELPVPANRLEASAGDAKTVLVDKDCLANPRGPGC